MSYIQENYRKIKDNLPSNVQLIAVSKTKTNEDILKVYQIGHRVFGESKAQEMVPKYEALPKDIYWHMIGHLQTNKVKYIAPFVRLIHSVDSFKLLKTINKEAKKNNRVIDCLIQMHIAEEESKYGFDIEELNHVLCTPEFGQLDNICIRGLMGMATFTDNIQQIRKEFRSLKTHFDNIHRNFFADQDTFNIVSMGMSDDYFVAIEEGSNMIRVGSSIFGQR